MYDTKVSQTRIQASKTAKGAIQIHSIGLREGQDSHRPAYSSRLSAMHLEQGQNSRSTWIEHTTTTPNWQSEHNERESKSVDLLESCWDWKHLMATAHIAALRSPQARHALIVAGNASSLNTSIRSSIDHTMKHRSLISVCQIKANSFMYAMLHRLCDAKPAARHARNQMLSETHGAEHLCNLSL